MTITAASIFIAVTSAGAGGRAESVNLPNTPGPTGVFSGPRDATGDGSRAGNNAAAPSADQPSEVAYWSHLAKKRLRLLGARERRIVELLRRVRHDSRERGGSGDTERRGGVRGAICSVFGAHCSEALRVAWCESRFNVYARNSQYWGLFQMGSFARAKYGHSWNAWGQSRSAYRYFLDAGWSPWACRP